MAARLSAFVLPATIESFEGHLDAGAPPLDAVFHRVCTIPLRIIAAASATSRILNLAVAVAVAHAPSPRQ